MVLLIELVAASLWVSRFGRPPDHYTLQPVNLGSARTGALLARVDADMGPAVDAVDRFWGPDWPHHIVVVATDSQSQFIAQSRLDPGMQWSDIAAVAVADEVDVANRRAVGQRVVLAPGAVNMSDAALRIVLTHELFHLAARADTAVDAPRWLTEGVADFVARPQAPMPPASTQTTSIPTDADLDGAGPGRSAGYDRAWWFAEFVADTYGVDGLRRLYVAACGPGHGDFSSAVRDALGVDIATLQTRWAQWLTG